MDEEELTVSVDSESVAGEIRSIEQLIELLKQNKGIVGRLEFASKRYKIKLPLESEDICSPESPTTPQILTTRLDPTSDEPLEKDPDNPFTVEQTPHFETDEDSKSNESEEAVPLKICLAPLLLQYQNHDSG
jgi:hypothetical protein